MPGFYMKCNTGLNWPEVKISLIINSTTRIAKQYISGLFLTLCNYINTKQRTFQEKHDYFKQLKIYFDSRKKWYRKKDLQSGDFDFFYQIHAMTLTDD